MSYFQRFVQRSACIQWEKDGESGPFVPTAEESISRHDVEACGVHLAFKDAFTHFVHGGDAFDHGADLSFGAALLDFKARFPERVHFVLGNRDINKMVMVPAIEEVGSVAPEEAERKIFPLHREADGLRPGETHYTAFLQKEGFPADTKANCVTFLKWALSSKMGSPNAFEHRRTELARLRRQERSLEGGGQESASHAVTDREVAESFFDASRPGGVYYEYIRHGVLALPLGGVLFVHGGVNERNAGFVPDRAVLGFAEQAARGQRLTVEEGKDDALTWIRALHAFKEESFREWTAPGAGHRGEVIRRYVFPRDVVPYSVTVGSFVGFQGPQFISLPAVDFLLSGGLHTVCSGHQPVGDTPMVVRQPGGFLMIDADNSYCGRGNEYCTPGNSRGLAVQEVVFHVDAEPESDDGGGHSHPAAAGLDDGPRGGRDSVQFHGLQADGRPFRFSLETHPLIGRFAGDGWWVKLPLYPSSSVTDVDTSAWGDWVPVQPADGAGAAGEAPFYQLCRTRDGYRSEEVMILRAEELRQRLAEFQRHGHVPLPGSLRPRYTKEELAEVPVHRVKTKVPASGAQRPSRDRDDRHVNHKKSP